jgi:hypothetical protein
MKTLGAALLAHVADLTTTAYGLPRGSVEMNPVGAVLLAHGWLTTAAFGFLVIFVTWAVLGRLHSRVAGIARAALPALLVVPALLNFVTIAGSVR